ncbi:uncharacterized protein [Clinocottus analis]|uniref:uncharacterized protein n=1 Tax=Clinocottus analis TaxID=304258 RepID=UPI0035C04799
MLRYITGLKPASRSASSGNVESRRRCESPLSSSSEDVVPFNSPKASNQRRGAVRRESAAEILSSEPRDRPLSAGDIRLVFEEPISERRPSVQDPDGREPEEEETKREKREERDRQTKERRNQRTNVGLLSRTNLQFLNLSAVTEIIDVQVLNESDFQICENHNPPREEEETEERCQRGSEPDASQPRTAAGRSEASRYARTLVANVYGSYRRADNRIYPF